MDKNFSLEANIQRIRVIVEEMQKGVSDFDKQVELFKEGTALVKACQDYLNTSEMEIQQLLNGQLIPFKKEE